MDGGWWMVDGGWWMVDGGCDENEIRIDRSQKGGTPQSDSGLNNRRILVVEDSPDVLYLLEMFLEREGFLLMSAANGQEALDLLRSTQDLPAFILLDLMMPVMDGAGFRSEQLKDKRLAATPVVLLSAGNDIGAEATRLGANAFVKKPPNVKDLLKLAEQFCR